jgi:TP901 family phage tail tape measure protein
MADLNARILINATDRASGVLNTLRENAGKAAAAITAYFAVDFFKSVVESAADFELALDKVAAKGGYAADEMQKLRVSAQDIGATFGVSGTKAAEGLEVLAAAGLKSSEAISALPNVMKLAKAENMSMEESATIVSNTVSTMGLSFDDTARIAGTFVKAANLSTVSAKDLGEAFKYSASIASGSKLSLEELAGVMDALASKGVKGSEAGTALRSILLQLDDPASKASKELDKLGISSRDLATVMTELKSRGDNSKDAMRAFGTESATAIKGLVDIGGTAIGGFADKIRGAGDAAGSTATTMAENFKGAQGKLSATFENLKVVIGTPILKPLSDSFNSLSDKFKQFIDSGVADQIGKSLASAFEAGVNVFAGFVKTIDFTTIGEKVKGFAIATAQTFDEVSSGVKATANVFSLGFNSIGLLFNGLQTTAASFGVAVVTMFGTINKIVGQVAIGWGEIFKLIPGMESAGKAIGDMGTNLSKSADASIEFAKALKEEAVVQANQTAESATKAAIAFDNLTESATKTAPKIADIWSQSNKTADAQERLTNTTDNVAQAQQNAAKQVDNSSPKWVRHIDELGRITYENISLQKATDKTTKTLADSGKGVGDLSALYTKQVDELGRVTLGNIGLANATDEAKKSTDGLSKSVDAIPDKESKITANTTAANTDVENVKAKIAEIPAETKTTAKVNEEGTQAVLDALGTIPRDITVTVHTVQGNQNGGQIQYFSKGGSPDINYNFQRRSGGLGGYGGGDTVPAMLEPGEWVIKKESVKKYGDGFMAKLNAGQVDDLPKFATGGSIGIETQLLRDEREITSLVRKRDDAVKTGSLQLSDWTAMNFDIDALREKITREKEDLRLAKEEETLATKKTTQAPSQQAQPTQPSKPTITEEIIIRFIAANGTQATAQSSKNDAKIIVEMIKQASLSS